MTAHANVGVNTALNQIGGFRLEGRQQRADVGGMELRSEVVARRKASLRQQVRDRSGNGKKEWSEGCHSVVNAKRSAGETRLARCH